MNIQLSPDNLTKAYHDADKYALFEPAKREFNILYNDGMTINIPQDNLYDKIINRLDSRRILLEKKTEILNEYYGDRLLAKDLFKDYISQKKFSSNLAYLLSLGLIGVNIYTKIMKNSIFLGKIGTLIGIAALHSTGRYISNNWLEDKIDRPWKIHNYRMSKGMGPTNIPSNRHSEMVICPLRFNKFQINPNDLIFGTDRNYTAVQLDVKIPIDKDQFPYEPDAHHHTKLSIIEEITPQRWKYSYGKYEKGYDALLEDLFSPGRGYENLSLKRIPEYQPFLYLSREYMWESYSIYRPSRLYKLNTFMIKKPENNRDDKLVMENEYLFEPELVDSKPDLPEWSFDLNRRVNITEDRINLVKHQIEQRQKLKDIRKKLTEDLKVNKDMNEYKMKMKEFRDELIKSEKEYIKKSINIIDDSEPLNEFLLINEEDKKHLENYYNLVYLTRPVMEKHKEEEFEHDFDFEIDTQNYDPWKEYQLTYRDIFKKGKSYWIIKNMPEWKFLQIGKPNSVEGITHHPHNFKRPNMNDSIFTLLTIERYFDERRSKDNLYKGKSQAIRI